MNEDLKNGKLELSFQYTAAAAVLAQTLANTRKSNEAVIIRPIRVEESNELNNESKANPELEIVMGLITSEQSFVWNTIPCLKSALLYADKVTLVLDPNETLPALSGLTDFFKIVEIFGNLLDYGFAPRYRFEQNSNDIISVAQNVEAMLDSPNKIPLIYDTTGFVVSQHNSWQKLMQPTKIRQSAEARLGSALIDKLPGFDKLSPIEVFEIRKHLKPYLTPFRSYVLETSEAVSSYIYDKEALDDIINELYRKKVRKAINELNDEWQNSSFIKTLLREFGSNPNEFMKSFLTFGVGHIIGLPLEVTAAAATAATAVSPIIRAINKMTEKRKNIKKEGLYMLNEIEHSIQKKK